MASTLNRDRHSIDAHESCLVVEQGGTIARVGVCASSDRLWKAVRRGIYPRVRVSALRADVDGGARFETSPDAAVAFRSLPLGLARELVRATGMADSSSVQQLEQRVGAVSLEQQPAAASSSPAPSTSTSTASPTTASPDAVQSPVNAAHASPGPPPALSPRASAPAAVGPGSAPRKPPTVGGAGSANALRQGVRGPGGGPLKMPPSLAAKMAAVRF